VDLREPNDPKIAGTVAAITRPGVGVSVMGFLIGDRTIVVGDASGGVSSWQLLQADGGERRLTKIYDFTPHAGPVVAFAPSSRDKGFVTADASGVTLLRYGTTGETLLSIKGEGGNLSAAAFAPKADGIVTFDAAGRLSQWALHNPHPETTLRSLFGKVWYEGYASRLRVAVHRRHGRLRGQVQPDAPDLWHAQGDLLRPAHRDSGGLWRRSTSEFMHPT
jgi:phosphate transport system permease protein